MSTGPGARSHRRAPLIATIATAVIATTLSAVAITQPVPAAAAPGDVAYAQDFDDVANGELPEGWQPVVGSWAVQEGRLVGEPGAITRITFGPHLENFRFEATIRFDAVNNASRWMAPILDIAPNGASPWWQGALRSRSTASNGVELAERTAGNTWSVPYTAAAPYDAGTGRDVPIAIEVQGTRARWFFDGVQVLQGTIGRSADGVLGFSADGARISVDDVVVTELEPWSPVLDDGALPVTAAHRGYSAVNPENTLAAYAAAVRTGAEFVEIDVHTTADGVPVVMHDQTVDRTTNGTGNVANLQSSYFTSLEAGSWYSPAFAEQPAPTFQQMLDLMATGSSKMLLEIKGPETQAEVNRIIDMVVDQGLADRVVVQSFDTNVLRYAKERAPQITTGLLGSLSADPVARARELGVSMYNPDAGSLAANLGAIQQLNDAGIAVFVWTVNSAAQWKQFSDAGVDGIITDRAGELEGWKQAQLQAPDAPEPEVPEPDAPTITVVAPADGGMVERGDDVVVAAWATDADGVTVTLDGERVANGAVVAAADLALGEHTVVATATGEGGEATDEVTFTVGVTAEGMRSRLAATDVSTGQLQQLLTALDSRDWDGLRTKLGQHIGDADVVATLSAEVDALAAG